MTFHQIWIMAVENCHKSDNMGPRHWCQVRRPGVPLAFQYISKVFSGVKTSVLCRLLHIFYFYLDKPCLHEPCFVPRDFVMLEHGYFLWRGIVMLQHEKTSNIIVDFQFCSKSLGKTHVWWSYLIYVLVLV